MPKISIIMPSLNVADYIQECLDSVVCQTLADIEVLCVDAGSTDGTLKIIENYAKKDRRIRIIHSPRKSYGFQMNLGIKEAVGEYIGIVETDDFILPEMYEELYNCAKEQNADFVKSDFDVFTTLPGGQRLFLRYTLEKYSSAKYNTIFTADDYFDNKKTIDVFIWNGIYKKTFLEKNRIMFQETPGAAFQDCGFRYQVALNTKRGFFLNHSFYRYRRDNVHSSTYNSRCVLFNLSECRNLIRITKENNLSQRQMEFLAREFAVIAHRPYIELLTWGQPSEGTQEALNEFRHILKDFIKQGILKPTSVTAEAWSEIRIFTEDAALYDHYSRIKAKAAAETAKFFLKNLFSKEQIILFGNGYIGSCAYCLIRNNGIEHITAFCDNDKSKCGSLHMGVPVISPEDAVKQFPDAYFLIANAAHSDAIQKQLSDLGIRRQQITMYDLSTSPMECTNMIMRSSRTMKQDIL